MNIKKYWVLSDNITICSKIAIQGECLLLEESPSILTLVNCGVLTDVKPKVVYNKRIQPNKSKDLIDESNTLQEEVKPKRRRKRNGRKPTEGVSELRDTPAEIPSGLPGVESSD